MGGGKKRREKGYLTKSGRATYLRSTIYSVKEVKNMVTKEEDEKGRFKV